MVFEATGWYSYDEFTLVFGRLQNPVDYPYIASKISIWQSRAKVPAAVAATESLIVAVIADLQGSLSECGLRSLYAMAVIRAVNLLLDQEQDREYARSLRLIAKACDFPEYIIKVRNDCSHREIPAINTLRITACDAISYVYQKYWLAQYKSIMYKLDNRDYDCLCLCSLLLCCYSTSLTELPSGIIELHGSQLRLLRGYIEPELVLLFQDPIFKSAIRSCRRSLFLYKRRSHLSFHRRTHRVGALSPPLCDSAKVAFYTLLIHQVCGLSKRLIDGCVHDTFFTSVFVEFVFAHFQPSRYSLFVVILLEVLGHLPFNFSVQFAGALLDVVLDLCTGSSDEGVVPNPPCYVDRMAMFCKFISTPVAVYIQKSLDTGPAISSLSDVGLCAVRRRINSWLMSLLEWSVNYHDGRSSVCPLYTMVLGHSVVEESQRMYTTAGNGLSRFAKAVNLLLPYCAMQLSSRKNSKPMLPQLKPQAWENDRLSYVLGLYAWLEQYHISGRASKYRFSVMSDCDKSELLEVMRYKCSRKCSDLDNLLLPGTLWDPYGWRIRYTVPRIVESRCHHSRIMDAISQLMDHIPIKLSGKNNRRHERSGRRLPAIPVGLSRNSRAIFHIVAQLNASTKHLSHRERF